MNEFIQIFACRPLFCCVSCGFCSAVQGNNIYHKLVWEIEAHATGIGASNQEAASIAPTLNFAHFITIQVSNFFRCKYVLIFNKDRG